MLTSSLGQRTPARAPRPGAGHGSAWPAHLLLAFIVASLVALVTVPVAADRYMRPLRDEMRTLAEPGRGLMTEIHVALALQASALHDFGDTRDEQYLRRYRQAAVREQRAGELLAPIAARLGPSTTARLAEYREMEAYWHASVDRFLERAGGGGAAGEDPLRGELYDDLLVAAAQLDEAIHQEAQLRRGRILEAERAAWWSMVALSAIALLALAAVAWIGGRLRAFAAEADRRRHEAEELMESRGRLMRGISHDLKNPLNAIDGHAELLEDEVVGPLTPRQRTSVERMRRSVRSMLRLIDDLLELYRIDAGHLELHRQRVDVRGIAADLVEEYRAMARGAGHRVELVESNGLPPVMTDPERVRQVLGNLLSNAVKYTPPGGRIIVRTERRTLQREQEGADALAVDVIDTGPGIAGDKQEEIFHEFSRLSPDEHPGAGLGLAISRRIARQLGGDITVASEPGRGSRFTLWLTLAPAEHRRQSRAAPDGRAR
ncbi:MAG TPA: HAMP domain-containing sensor histidine kinase [Gemmatimonadaceae bacterium]|nr:HAMP domain-containing sensor histidine kinase [Gemmatimonadaceae bacterium]